MKGGGGRSGTDAEVGEFQPDDENVWRGGGKGDNNDDDAGDDEVADGLATTIDGSITTVVLIGLKDRWYIERRLIH
jgi:hypothetical protein